MFGDVLFRARIGIDEMLVKPDILEEDRNRVAIPYKGSKIGAPNHPLPMMEDLTGKALLIYIWHLHWKPQSMRSDQV